MLPLIPAEVEDTGPSERMPLHPLTPFPPLMEGDLAFIALNRRLEKHIEQSRLDASELGVLTLIHLQCDYRTLVWFGSAAKVANLLCVTEKQGRRILESLESKGFIVRTTTPGRRGNYPIKLTASSGRDMGELESSSEASSSETKQSLNYECGVLIGQAQGELGASVGKPEGECSTITITINKEPLPSTLAIVNMKGADEETNRAQHGIPRREECRSGDLRNEESMGNHQSSQGSNGDQVQALPCGNISRAAQAHSPSSVALDLVRMLVCLMGENNPRMKTIRPEQVNKWGREADLMIARDGRTEEEISAVIQWCQADQFWKSNILSMTKLREKFDQLAIKMRAPVNGRISQADAVEATAARMRDMISRGEL